MKQNKTAAMVSVKKFIVVDSQSEKDNKYAKYV